MNENQGHGDHIGAVIDTREFVTEHLEKTINSAQVYKKFETQAVSDSIKGQTTDVIALINDEHDIAWQTLLALSADKQRYEFVTCVPLLNPIEAVEAKILKVEPWKNLIEATVTCEIDEETVVSFFATDYAWSKDKYVEGATVNLYLAALAYRTEAAEKEFSFEGQQAVEFLAKMGKEPDYDENGNVQPVHFSMEMLVAFLNTNEDFPDDFEFQSPVSNMAPITSIGEAMSRCEIMFKHDPDRVIPLYYKSEQLATLNEGEPARGLLWLQGRLVEE